MSTCVNCVFSILQLPSGLCQESHIDQDPKDDTGWIHYEIMPMVAAAATPCGLLTCKIEKRIALETMTPGELSQQDKKVCETWGQRVENYMSLSMCLSDDNNNNMDSYFKPDKPWRKGYSWNCYTRRHHCIFHLLILYHHYRMNAAAGGHLSRSVSSLIVAILFIGNPRQSITRALCHGLRG